MNTKTLWILAAVVVIGVAACGSDASNTKATGGTTTETPTSATNRADEREFCSTMKQVMARLEPETTPRTPSARQTQYAQLAALLDRAQAAAPQRLHDDLARFALAIDAFAAALAKVGYNLDTIYSTPKGVRLAADTSHALSPRLAAQITGPCGLAPNNGENRTP
jgi:hypothetical protein